MPDAITRRFLRLPVLVEFRVRDADDVVGGDLMFDSLDVSEGGAFLRSDYLLDEGDRLEVSFNLPGQDQPIHVRAKVVWVTKKADIKGEAGMGLQFTDLQEDERGAIAEFVRAQKTQSSSHNA